MVLGIEQQHTLSQIKRQPNIMWFLMKELSSPNKWWCPNKKNIIWIKPLDQSIYRTYRITG